ncbi:hypothetical protein A6A04_03425 [Paramagnetospirillum marisnigri]|uniref:SGNH hydrolase-type esterase domain-containing protein n=1 Tax=Paramagnetospirillum marisnigri TaxID=1285242 RepID=A0A178MM61_9PROT|nr:hypothetical protein [Paramagnetospirillum marisnigri]OAN49178.1 hypothetical protein A6A04_03425 [Paramagnetospirillum marisnigri]
MLRPILIQTAKLLAPTLAAYLALLWLAAGMDFPADSATRLDSADAERSILATEPAYVMFASKLLAGRDPAVMLIGPSNVKAGFRPAELAPLLPGVAVHNMAVSGSNIDAMAAAVDLVYGQRPPESRDGLVLVFGLWNGEFLHNESIPATTQLGRQMQRFGIFQHGPDGFTLQVGAGGFQMATTLLRPIFALQILIGSQSPLARRLAARTEDQAPAQRPPARDFELPTAQFETLVAVADKVARQGGRLVLVDLPLPVSFSGPDPMWHRYQAAKGPWLAAARAKGAVYVDMQDMNAEEDLDGATHPLPHATHKWAERLAAELKANGVIPAR